MIGWSSFLIELMGLVGPFIFMIAAYGARKEMDGKLTGLAVIIFPVVMALLMAPRFYYQVMIRHQLATLDIAQLREIRVGDKALTRAQAIAVVAALRPIQSFSMNHGGVAASVPLTIVWRDGTVLTVGCGRYIREGRGAVLSFSRAGWSGTGWADGYGHCQELPAVLQAAGMSLAE